MVLYRLIYILPENTHNSIRYHSLPVPVIEITHVQVLLLRGGRCSHYISSVVFNYLHSACLFNMWTVEKQQSLIFSQLVCIHFTHWANNAKSVTLIPFSMPYRFCLNLPPPICLVTSLYRTGNPRAHGTLSTRFLIQSKKSNSLNLLLPKKSTPIQGVKTSSNFNPFGRHPFKLCNPPKHTSSRTSKPSLKTTFPLFKNKQKISCIPSNSSVPTGTIKDRYLLPRVPKLYSLEECISFTKHNVNILHRKRHLLLCKSQILSVRYYETARVV